MPALKPSFISLADALCARPASAIAEPPVLVPAPEPLEEWVRAAQSEPDEVERAAALRDARLFRAAIADAVDAAVANLLRRIAVDVVARELRLGDVDIAKIVSDLLEEYEADEPVRLRVCAADAVGIVAGVAVSVDPALEAGDAILECREGSVDARLGVRLAEALRTCTP